MLAILGGTGPEGKGLALRLALAGEAVVIGSRSAERGVAAAAELAALASSGAAAFRATIMPGPRGAARWCFWPFLMRGQRPVLEQLAGALEGKVVVSVIAPMAFERGRGARAVSVAAGSAAEEAQELLPGSQVVAAFQNASAEELQDPRVLMEGDVVVCSDHSDARRLVMGLAGRIPNLRGVDGGALFNARYVEQITPLLVNINRIYRAHSGVKITGI